MKFVVNRRGVGGDNSFTCEADPVRTLTCLH